MPANRPDAYNSNRDKFLSNIKYFRGVFLWGATFFGSQGETESVVTCCW